MRRWIVRLLLLVMLPWQGMAWAGGALGGEPADAARHAVAHWSGEAHHHHGDGHDHDAVHPDDSLESLLHLVQTNAHWNAPAVLPAPPACPGVALPAAAPDDGPSPEHPHPFLEGPRRPPRLHG